MAASRSKQGATLAEAFPLSIIIPTYNSESTLGACLQGLQANGLEEGSEVTVVDDASSDGTREVARESGIETLRLICLEKNSGPARARNEGARQASHPHLLFVDADVVLCGRALEMVRESLDLYSHRKEVAGVLGSYEEGIPDSDFWTNYKNLTTCYLYHRTETLSPFLHTPILCIRRSTFLQFGGFDERRRKAEDFQLGLRLGSRGFRFVIDRRLKGRHLKRYTPREIIREDWSRIRALQAMQLEPEERRFAYRAHRWDRLISLTLPGLSILLLLAAYRWPASFWLALFCVLLFGLVNFSFLNYLRRKKGFLFACGSALFLYLEMLLASLCLGLSAGAKPLARIIHRLS